MTVVETIEMFYLINFTRHGDRSTLRHLPALNNKRNYCIRTHVQLSIGLTVTHISNWAFQGHVN